MLTCGVCSMLLQWVTWATCDSDQSIDEVIKNRYTFNQLLTSIMN